MANTLFVGKVYHYFDSLPSTNDFALEMLAKSKPPEGTAIRAASQSAGRGQYGSRWESAPGENLTLSIILYPHWLAIPRQFYLSMAVALAVRDTAMQAGAPEVSVKWPNDVYSGARKVAGILIQNSLQGQRLQASVIGIGLNVNQRVFDPGLPNPASLASVCGRDFMPDTVMENLFTHLEARYLQLKSGQEGQIKSAYEAGLFRRDTPSTFARPDGETFTGILRGVSEAGLLQVETAHGTQHFETKAVKLCL